MGTNFSATPVQSGFQSTDELNDTIQNIQTALTRSVSRFGESPNFMEVELDLNDNRLLNVAEGTLGTDGVNLSQVIQLATDIASTLLQTIGNVEVVNFTNSNPLTFNFGTATGSQGLNNRTEFNLQTLFGVENLNGLTVIINGVVQTPGAAYSVTDTTLVTMSESLEPDSDILFIYGDLSPTPVFSNAKATLSETASVATAGQTVVTAPTYVIGQNQLMVHIDGLMQSITLGDFTETTTTSITLDEPMVGGERLVIRNITGV